VEVPPILKHMAASIYLKESPGRTSLEEARAAMAKAFAMALGRCVSYGIVTVNGDNPPALTAKGHAMNGKHLRHTYAGKTRLFDALYGHGSPSSEADVSGVDRGPQTEAQLHALEETVRRTDVEL